MQTTGKVIEKLPEISGENDRGAWIIGGFVILSTSERGEKLCYEVSGTEKCKIVQQIQIGETIVVSWRPISRKYGDRWYTSLKCYEISTLKKGGDDVTH